MQIPASHIAQHSPLTMKTSLSDAVAGNREIESAASITLNRPLKVVSLNESVIGLETESNLTQQQREQAVEESGLFKHQAKFEQDFNSTLMVPESLSQRANVEYETDSASNKGAINMYLMTQHAAKRDEIQQMVGIDVFV
ncbi:hypothetical protein [Shewanella gaetbuli]